VTVVFSLNGILIAIFNLLFSVVPLPQSAEMISTAVSLPMSALPLLNLRLFKDLTVLLFFMIN